MCRDCVVSACFIAYHKAQIDKLSAAVAEMAIAPSHPNVWYVCLIHLDVRCHYSLVSCLDSVMCLLHNPTRSVFLLNLTVANVEMPHLFCRFLSYCYIDKSKAS